MENTQKKYNITDKQEIFGLKKAVQKVADNIGCPPEWCTVEKVVNIDSSQEEYFSHYAISATAVDIPTGKETQIEIAHLATNGYILRDYGDLHPDILQHLEEVNSPTINPDLIDEHTVIENSGSDLDDIDELFSEY